MSSSKTCDLFGGALTVILPSNLIDASQLREVPDTQEVFLSPESDVSIIFEILEKVEPDDAQEIAKFHFFSLAHDNDAAPESCVIDKVIDPAPATTINAHVTSILHGTQLVPKFNRIQPDKVKILLGIYRIHEKNIDITMVFNVPIKTENEGGAVAFGSEKYQAWESSFEEAVKSFKVIDYGLFA